MAEIRLAPMCGITDFVFRGICYELGCDLAYTEMISAMGYLCAPEQRATKELMIRGENEPRLILQLFGKDPETVAEAARKISGLGIYDGIDLNMGCPARKVACSGEGSGLMRTPDVAGRMMEMTVRATKLPVSVKMRIGWDEAHRNVMELARMAEDAGIREITIHGRTREQQYSGKADWETIREVKEKLTIPVIGNGDIFTASDAVERLKEAKTDGVMIGRGVMGNPWIFREIKDAIAGRPVRAVTVKERMGMIRKHYGLMLQHKPEAVAVREMRKHIGWYIHGIRGASRVRFEINRCGEPQKALEMLEELFVSVENGA